MAEESVEKLKAEVQRCCGKRCKEDKLYCPLAFTWAQEEAERTGDPVLFSPSHLARRNEGKEIRKPADAEPNPNAA